MITLITFIQRFLATLSYSISRLFKRKKTITWVIGPTEVASMVRNMANSIPDSFSVMLQPNPYYSDGYDYIHKTAGNFFYRTWMTWIYPAWFFGKLAAKATGFIYIGSNSFLVQENDQREFEFNFLKKRNLTLVCYFTGTDIRSVKLMKEFAEKTGIENLGTKLLEAHPEYGNAEYDSSKKRIAFVADKYADVIFNSKIDQMSYLQTETKPFLYFFPDDQIQTNLDKFNDYENPVVVHAPSNPKLKGTALVRSAVDQLKQDGFRFEYVELQNVSNEKVLEQLSKAHIVLNEFYSFVPGVFGVEAMAHGCAVITSADEKYETDLPPASNEAWFVTSPQDIYAHLKVLLSDRLQACTYAGMGINWVKNNASYSKSAKRLLDTISQI